MTNTSEFTAARFYGRPALALVATSPMLEACFSGDDSAGGGSAGSQGSTSELGTSTTTPPEPPPVTDNTTAESSTSPTMEPPVDADSTTGNPGVCGNGVVEEGEVCDDRSNDGSYGGCASDCQSLAPHCGDDNVNGPEACDDANDDSTDGCLANCSVPASCMDVLAYDLAATSGIHEIDSDGPGGYGAYDAHCDMEHAGGGWTLVIVSADDGHHTWTWQNHELLTTDTFLVGNVEVRAEDYKSAALHLMAFSDLLFVHEPSGVWASYDDVGDGSSDVGTFMSDLPFPQCDLGSGFPMTDGELTQIGTSMCSTDLYFHTGNHNGTFGGQASCEAFVDQYVSATYGPAWSTADNDGCPMDDPNGSSLGPAMLPNYEFYPPEGIEDVEWDGRGFAYGMGLTQPDDRLEMYVR